MNKILIDTVYLYPIFGIDVGIEKYNELFPKLLDSYEVYYNPISLIESKLLLFKLIKKDKNNKNRYLEAYLKGLRVILRDKRLKQTLITNSEIEEESDKLIDVINNYFRRIIYATAKVNKLVLLTESKNLLNQENVQSLNNFFMNK
jgi:hypothetical protein